MADSDLILAKAGSVRSHLKRVTEKRDVNNEYLKAIIKKLGLTD